MDLSFDDFSQACTTGDLKDEGWKAFNDNFEAMGPNSLARRVAKGFKTDTPKAHKKLWDFIPTLKEEE